MINTLLKSFGTIYSSQHTNTLLKTLTAQIKWQTDFIAYGRRFDLPRRQAWYADRGVHYRNSDNKMQTQVWNEVLSSIKQNIEQLSGHQFNSVLLTYYRNGMDNVGWHADNEVELGDAPVIASLSLGATRHFHYRNKQTSECGSLPLYDGELHVMQPAFQQDWEHSILPESEVLESRINLTFRQVVC